MSLRTRQCCGLPSRAASQPRTDTPVRMTSIGWADGGHAVRVRSSSWRASHASDLSLALYVVEFGLTSAACREPAGARSPRTRRRSASVEDVVATVVQVVARAADAAQRRVAGGHARQRDRLLRLECAGSRRGGVCVAHVYVVSSVRVIFSWRRARRACLRIRDSRGIDTDRRVTASFQLRFSACRRATPSGRS
jgi:hypothetical protein